MQELLYKIGDFDYQLDVLIDDIKQNKISIFDVPIAQIVEQFKNIYREASEKFEIGDLTFFYRSTAELLFIKIIRLLPIKDSEYDGSEERILREQVINALEKLKFSQYTDLLIRYKREHALDFNRNEFPFRIPYSDENLLEGVRLNDLARVYIELMQRYSQSSSDASSFTFKEAFNDSMKRRKKALLLELFEKNDRIWFSQLIGEHPTRDLTLQHLTMAFLAVVEAIDEKVCDYEQEYCYADICLIKIYHDYSGIDVIEADRAYEELIENARELAYENEQDDYSLSGDDGDD